MNTLLKKCRNCRNAKALNEFRNKAQNRDGKENECTECARARSKLRFQTSESYRASTRTWQIKQKAILHDYVLDYLTAHPCVDCGEADPVVLEFDHVRGVKTENVSRMITNASALEKLVAEIAKCDVRCCNCHRRVTLSRMGSTYRAKIKDLPFPA